MEFRDPWFDSPSGPNLRQLHRVRELLHGLPQDECHQVPQRRPDDTRPSRHVVTTAPPHRAVFQRILVGVRRARERVH